MHKCVVLAVLVLAAVSNSESKLSSSTTHTQPTLNPSLAAYTAVHRSQGLIERYKGVKEIGSHNSPSNGLPLAHPQLQWVSPRSHHTHRRLRAASAVNSSCTDSCAGCRKFSVAAPLLYTFENIDRMRYTVQSTDGSKFAVHVGYGPGTKFNDDITDWSTLSPSTCASFESQPLICANIKMYLAIVCLNKNSTSCPLLVGVEVSSPYKYSNGSRSCTPPGKTHSSESSSLSSFEITRLMSKVSSPAANRGKTVVKPPAAKRAKTVVKPPAVSRVKTGRKPASVDSPVEGSLSQAADSGNTAAADNTSAELSPVPVVESSQSPYGDTVLSHYGDSSPAPNGGNTAADNSPVPLVVSSPSPAPGLNGGVNRTASWQDDDGCDGHYIEQAALGTMIKWNLSTWQPSSSAPAYVIIKADIDPVWEQQQRNKPGHLVFWHEATVALQPAGFEAPQDILVPHMVVHQKDGSCLATSVYAPLYGGYAEFFVRVVQVPTGVYLGVWGKLQGSMGSNAAMRTFNAQGWTRSVVKFWSSPS